MLLMKQVRKCSVGSLLLQTMKGAYRQPLTRLGQLLREARETRGLSTYDLSRLSKVSQSYISMIERGHISSGGKPVQPAAPVLRALSDALGIEYAAILDAAGYAPDREPGLQHLIDRYRHLSPDSRKRADAYLDFLDFEEKKEGERKE